MTRLSVFKYALFSLITASSLSFAYGPINDASLIVRGHAGRSMERPEGHHGEAGHVDEARHAEQRGFVRGAEEGAVINGSNAAQPVYIVPTQPQQAPQPQSSPQTTNTK